jgi:hypothetical protein
MAPIWCYQQHIAPTVSTQLGNGAISYLKDDTMKESNRILYRILYVTVKLEIVTVHVGAIASPSQVDADQFDRDFLPSGLSWLLLRLFQDLPARLDE